MAVVVLDMDEHQHMHDQNVYHASLAFALARPSRLGGDSHGDTALWGHIRLHMR